ncbi:MAG: hypothetical protein M1827_004806 [Pycnora praestabilis]|nr:MAG: hypothetical protein M1827_004806 [Pycnora praestabilis]
MESSIPEFAIYSESYLDSQNVIEIHTPILRGRATKSRSSVFKAEYFGRQAFLAQSPQFAKQMSIPADSERVYEIGPVFRAENSDTHRHQTEYTGLDIEIAFEEPYHEGLQMIDETFKTVFKAPEDAYHTFYAGHQNIERLWVDGGRRLFASRREKYHTDYYILDKFPTSARPFYITLNPQDDRVTNSFDIFLRNQEVLTGGQRIHDAEMLEDRMTQQGINGDGMGEYLEGFRFGAPPHMQVVISAWRELSCFFLISAIFVWPHSSRGIPTVCLPNHLSQSCDTPKQILYIHHGKGEVPLMKITNTNPWDPLCDKSPYVGVIAAFLRWQKKEPHRKPIWVLVGKHVEEVPRRAIRLADTFTCAAGAHFDPSTNKAQYDHDVARNVRLCEREGVKITDIPSNETIPDDIHAECDKRMNEWLAKPQRHASPPH